MTNAEAMKIPEGYKQTEVGVIPEGWDLPMLGQVCTLINGRGFKPFEWSDRGLPIIRIQNLNGSDEFNYYSGLYDPKIFIEHNQLLFAWSGSRGTSFGPHVWKGGDALLNYHTWKMVIDTKKIDSEFFYHALKVLTKIIEDSAHGASALVHTQKGDMEKFYFPMPRDRKEQTAIANALSDVDNLIAALETLIVKKSAIKIATMQQLLTGKKRLPGFAKKNTNTEQTAQTTQALQIDKNSDAANSNNSQAATRHGYKHTELGEIPEDWEVVELAQLLKYEQPTKYLVSSAEYMETGLVPVLTAGKSFILGYTAETNSLFTNLPVIIFDDFTTDTKYVDFQFKVKSSAMKMLIPRDNDTPVNLIHSVLSSVDFKVGDHKRHWISEFSKIKVKWPALREEQAAIASVLSDMDTELDALQQRLSKTKKIKQGMMQELLTGKTRLVK